MDFVSGRTSVWESRGGRKDSCCWRRKGSISRRSTRVQKCWGMTWNEDEWNTNWFMQCYYSRCCCRYCCGINGWATGSQHWYHTFDSSRQNMCFTRAMKCYQRILNTPDRRCPVHFGGAQQNSKMDNQPTNHSAN